MLIEPWFVLTMVAVFGYGISDGLYKQFLDESITVSRFCLYSVPITIVVYGYYFLTNEHAPPFAPEGREFMFYVILAATLENAAWILSFEALVSGPISIIAPVCAAYPAVTAVLIFLDARFTHLLDETLSPHQYLGVALVVIGCMGIAYEPSTPTEKPARRFLGIPIWFIECVLAAILWGIGGMMDGWVYELPNASEANFALFAGIATALALLFYGLIQEREWKFPPIKEPLQAFIPLGLNAVGDVAIMVAYNMGPATLVTTLSAASIPITLVYAFIILSERLNRFQWTCITLTFIGAILCSGP
ncbi:MAG: DMT family transporter [Acidobacteriota bacterium]|nr:MAG: DMT family transporter [Acidobacteriota bacterium]